MRKRPVIESLRIYALLLACAMIVWLCLPMMISNGRLGRKVRVMQGYRPELERALRAEPRFARVGTMGSTSGTLTLKGNIASPADFDGLVRLVQETNPRAPVYISVFVPLVLPSSPHAVPVGLTMLLGPRDP